MIEWWGPVIYEYLRRNRTGRSPHSTPQKKRCGSPAPSGGRRPAAPAILDADGRLLPGARLARSISGIDGFPDFTYHTIRRSAPRSSATASSRSADVGYVDDDGFLFLCDRESDMVIFGGINIYPAEIESALPGDAGCAGLRGLRHSGRRLRRKARGHIQTRPWGAAGPDEVMTFLAQRGSGRTTRCREHSRSTLPCRAKTSARSSNASCAIPIGLKSDANI